MTLWPMARLDGLYRARSHCRFVPPFIRFIPDSLTYSVPLFLKQRCRRTPGLYLVLHGAMIVDGLDDPEVALGG